MIDTIISMKKDYLRIGFFTFADGSSDFRDAAFRLANQASDLKMFNNVVYLNDINFREIDESWRDTAEVLDSREMLPYFYLGTKAWVIKAALEGTFGIFDLIFYADAGCELPNNCVTKKELRKLFKLAMQHGGIAEQLNYPEKTYTKKRLIDLFNLTQSEMDSGQVQATWSIWKNNNKSRQIATEWVNLSNPNSNLWNNPDEIELGDQEPYFIEHRRDQSIFSIIWKMNNYFLKAPYWEYGGKLGSIRGRAIPIHAIRNRSGHTKLPLNSKNCILAFIGKFINITADLSRKLFDKFS